MPIMLALGESVFLQTWNFRLSVPLLPEPLNWRDVLFLATLVAWSALQSARPRPDSLYPGWDLVGGWLLLLWFAFQTPLSWLVGGEIKIGIALAARGLLYVPLGFLLWADIFRRVTREEVRWLLESVAVLCVPLAGLYALSTLGVRIYEAAGIQSAYYQAAGVRRDILTFPVWAKIALPVLIVWPGKRPVWRFAGAAVILVACFLTYTRSIIVPGLAVVLICGLLLSGRTKGLAVSWLRPLLLIAAVGLALVVAGDYAPQGLQYLAQRFEEIGSSGLGVSTFQARLAWGRTIAELVGRVDPWLGYGFSDQMLGEAFRVGSTMFLSDVLWLPLLLFTGWLGVALTANMLAAYGRTSARLAWAAESPWRELGCVVFCVFVWDVSRSFASSELLTNLGVGATTWMALAAVAVRGAVRDTWPAKRRLGSLSEVFPQLGTPQGRRVAVALMIVGMLLAEVYLGRLLVR